VSGELELGVCPARSSQRLSPAAAGGHVPTALGESTGQRGELEEGCSRPTASKICRASGRRRFSRPSTTGRSSGSSTAPDARRQPSKRRARRAAHRRKRERRMARCRASRRLDLVSMKKGRVSTDGLGQAPRVGRGCGAVLMSLWPPGREDQAKLDVRSRAHVHKGTVMPPDEKRRLGERIAGCGKACARSRGRAGGRCRPGRPWEYLRTTSPSRPCRQLRGPTSSRPWSTRRPDLMATSDDSRTVGLLAEPPRNSRVLGAPGRFSAGT
jgi:hypothetical protein